ncbi:MAG: hypothetical protein K8W52_16255 [Deltaproteobacteria bacterium]|nr:hypothetical protein [Deltaproteobacteria bacterium]
MKTALVVATALALAGCRVQDPPPITERWADTFERDDPGPNYYQTGSGYAVVHGALSAHGAHNKPLWLRKKLPRDVQIDVTVWSATAEGDMKVEVFGDGKSFDPDQGDYTSTGYVLVQGGWHNTESKMARGYEHGTDNFKERRGPRVVPGQKYHWRIIRKGKVLTWYVDDMEVPYLTWDDPQALSGPGHEYFAISNWESDSWFDDLTITPL